MKKEQVYIDVYNTEDRYEVYFLGHYFDSPTKRLINKPAEICEGCGIFYDESNFEDFLQDNKKEIEIIRDYRID